MRVLGSGGGRPARQVRPVDQVVVLQEAHEDAGQHPGHRHLLMVVVAPVSNACRGAPRLARPGPFGRRARRRSRASLASRSSRSACRSLTSRCRSASSALESIIVVVLTGCRRRDGALLDPGSGNRARWPEEIRGTRGRRSRAAPAWPSGTSTHDPRAGPLPPTWSRSRDTDPSDHSGPAGPGEPAGPRSPTQELGLDAGIARADQVEQVLPVLACRRGAVGLRTTCQSTSSSAALARSIASAAARRSSRGRDAEAPAQLALDPICARPDASGRGSRRRERGPQPLLELAGSASSAVTSRAGRPVGDEPAVVCRRDDVQRCAATVLAGPLRSSSRPRSTSEAGLASRSSSSGRSGSGSASG